MKPRTPDLKSAFDKEKAIENTLKTHHLSKKLPKTLNRIFSHLAKKGKAMTRQRPKFPRVCP